MGAISLSGDSTTNVMMIAYLNLVLPTLENGDAIFFHGFTKVAGIADILQEMIASSGRRVCVVFTESNQNSAQKLLPLLNTRSICPWWTFTRIPLTRYRVT